MIATTIVWLLCLLKPCTGFQARDQVEEEAGQAEQNAATKMSTWTIVSIVLGIMLLVLGVVLVGFFIRWVRVRTRRPKTHKSLNQEHGSTQTAQGRKLSPRTLTKTTSKTKDLNRTRSKSKSSVQVHEEYTPRLLKFTAHPKGKLRDTSLYSTSSISSGSSIVSYKTEQMSTGGAYELPAEDSASTTAYSRNVRSLEFHKLGNKIVKKSLKKHVKASR